MSVMMEGDGSEGAAVAFAEPREAVAAGAPGTERYEALRAAEIAAPDARQRMRVVVTYASPQGAEAALDELRWAGLPRDADVLFAIPRWLFPRRSDRRRPRLFPQSWRVTTEPLPGVAPVGEEALRVAEEWNAELILVGSHGSRFLAPSYFGCISPAVAEEARCSVRIARTGVRMHATSPRVLVGVDGSAGSLAAVRAVAGRAWPRGAEAHVVAVSRSGRDAGAGVLHLAVDIAATELRAAGLGVSSEIRGGDASGELLDAARAWRADCVFVGASADVGGNGSSGLGRVAAALAAAAPCSVELVRPAGEPRPSAEPRSAARLLEP